MLRFLSRTAPKLAWRNLRASPVHFIWIAASLAISVAALAGLEGASRIAHADLRARSREWLAADLSVHTKTWLDENQTSALDRLRETGVEWTSVTSALTMARSDQSPEPALILVKAADTRHYPFYGTIALDPARPLALDAETVFVSEDLRARLNVAPGGRVQIGGATFKIGALIRNEPDRFAGTPYPGMRCILSIEGYQRSGIAAAGNSELYRILLRIPDEGRRQSIREQLERLFPGADVLDSRDAPAPALNALDAASSAFAMTTLFAFALGAAGTAITFAAFIERRTDSLAIMKILGGSSFRVTAVLLYELLAAIAAGLLFSLPGAAAIRMSILSLETTWVPFLSATPFDRGTLGTATLVIAMASIPSLGEAIFSIRSTRPAVLLRRNSGEPPEPRAARSPRLLLTVLMSVATAALAAFAADAGKAIAPFFGTMLAAILLAATGAVLCLKAARALAPACSNSALRLGLTMLIRSGPWSRIAIVGLAIGSMTLLGTFETDKAVLRGLTDSTPFHDADLLILNVAGARSEAIEKLLSTRHEIRPPSQSITMARLRIESVDGKFAEGAGAPLVSCSDAQTGLVIDDDVARRIGARVGSRVDFAGARGTTSRIVQTVRKMNPFDKLWRPIQIDCTGIEQDGALRHIAVRVNPGGTKSLRDALWGTFPALPVVTIDELLAPAGNIVEDALRLIRRLGWCRMAAAGFLLIAVFAASAADRSREIASFRALGATRRRMLQIYAVHFGSIGLAAGVIGALLAFLYTSVSLSLVFHRAIPAFDWRSSLACAAASAACVAIAGCAVVSLLISKKPLEILRRD